jgi:3-oxoacyl-[acyl-carrier protein] reductase
MSDAAGRTVIVSGSSGDIGRALTAHLHAAGWRVLGLDKSEPAGDDAATAAAACDLADRAATEKAIGDLVAQFGAPHAVINCVGLIANAPIVKLVDGNFAGHDAATWDAVIASNLTATFNVCVAAVTHMVATRTKGVIINFGSVAARGNPGQAAYAAAKAAIAGLTRTLARELTPFGIRAVCIAPGFIDTPSTRQNLPESRIKALTASTAPKRLGDVRELASAIDFILANEYYNGSTLELDGGVVL